MKLIEYELAGAPDYPQSDGLESFDPAMLQQQRVDEHWLAIEGNTTRARASLWWRDVPELGGERLGVIGHFAVETEEAAQPLLERCCDRLATLGCTLAVGPMDGNTWRRYRLVTDAGAEAPFFLEPVNPVFYPGCFEHCDFVAMAHYSSARVSDLGITDERIPRALRRLDSNGIRWRALDKTRFEDELRAIYALSVQCFRQNYLYTPISESEFIAQYRAVESLVQPELTLLAEHEGELQGYLFGIPDLNQSQRGETVDTFIVKTVAAAANRRAAGLGSVLVAESHRIAREHGYRNAIHALMHDGNQSRNLSAHYAKSIRRYTLYQRRLEAAR